MYLKSIEVHGFKSFAQKINFEFHNGITGIVGPNGSGKSNVADAVRWVLGEQSAKQLRGGNMQDVIFSGTETRKPLSYASVAITLDNSDHQLGVDFQEVTVTRRLYRSGESEYLINGSACRLRDINEMFYDTGIGKEGYSIIGQGQIDKILSGKPEDRRELFDEAAGIVKFKRRKNMTVKKLEEEQQNMVRLTDILSELTRQLGPLERQSEAAREYLARRDELRILDVNLFLMEYERGTKTLTEISEKLESAQEQLGMVQMVLGGIGGVSLLVAAIGIMNTMMMSIYERTKEIGVMKVLGCDMSDIRNMFLFESGIIGLMGGIAGLFVSYIISFIINYFTSDSGGESVAMFIGYTEGGSLSYIPMWLAGFAIVFAIAVGSIAGYVPAVRAMKLSPLAAIRNE